VPYSVVLSGDPSIGLHLACLSNKALLKRSATD
jgi:hypothetical protein